MAVQTIDVSTLQEWMKNNEVLLIDVREPAEHAAENIPGAVLLPLSGLTKNRLPESNGKKLVIHCRMGKRGENACAKLLAEDPDLELYNLEGGISAWSAAGKICTTSGKRFLPLDQQVQLTIGIMLLLASMLAYFLTPVFLLWTGLIGIGLIFAGLTGFCGLAVIMAKMPWNQLSSSSCKKRQ